MTTIETGVKGGRGVADADDVLQEIIEPDIGYAGVKSGLGFTPDFGEPSVTIAAGEAATSREGGATIYTPNEATVSLIENTKNYIYLRSTKDGLKYIVRDSKTSPHASAVYVGWVDTGNSDLREENRGTSAILGDVEVSAVGDEVHIKSVSDLPYPSGGVHTLDSSKSYVFEDFVVSADQLDPNGALLRGLHGSQGGFIYTGDDAAITSSSAFFAEEFYAHAPGSTLFDLDADNNTEMLVQSCAFSDAAGLGNIGSLGTINGYRVPTFKGCNFENFDSGLEFDGNADKVFVWGSPLREITASGVTIFTLKGSADIQIVDFADNYVKDVQSDTEVWRVEDGAEPSEVFQYRGTTHDTSVTKDNIISGPNAGAQVEPFWVSDSFPLRESNVVGELSLDAETTTAIDSTNTWYQVSGTTTVGNETERAKQVSDGVLEYIGSKDTNVHISVTSSFTGANGSLYRIGIGKNGTVEPASTMEIQAGGQNASKSLSTSSIEDLQTGDTISLLVQNMSDTNDATFQAYTINFLGM